MNFLKEKDLNKQIKSKSIKELDELSQSMREFLIENVSKTGGHLASNLGIVELTIALHSIFDTTKDKIIWDVGHQSYPHKILTNRADKFSTLRQYKGLSGFPKTTESIHDHFDVGHSSTSISAALGMAKARDLNGEKNYIIAVIGDGSIGNGLAFEAMNNVGKTKMIIILNDNEMSISKNVGSLSKTLTKYSAKTNFINRKLTIKKILYKIPILGRIFKRLKDAFKEMIEYNSFFTELGFKYVGPIDGHDIKELKNTINDVKDYNGPILIHVITKKGKGYKFAEEKPYLYHGVSKFDPTVEITEQKKDYSSVFGSKLTNIAKKNKKIVAISAAMTDGTGLTSFKEKYPTRYFDVGIAESHALTFAAGLAKAGYKPFIVLYSTFLQRAYDELVHDICMQNLNVTIGIDRAGLVGADGPTHHGVFDLSYLTHIPNLTIIAPSSFEQLEKALDFANTFTSPLAIRYPRGVDGDYKNDETLKLGKSKIVKKGEDLCIIGVGKMLNTALEVNNLLKDKYDIEIIDAIFVKPLDKNTILKSIKKAKKVCIIEDNQMIGGFGSLILNLISENNLEIKTKIFAYDDIFIEHGDTKLLEEKLKMDAKSIAKTINKWM